MGFSNVADLVADVEAGKTLYTYFRKVPAVATGAGTWYDYSMAPGNPLPQYYAASPLAAKKLTRTDDGGIPHGGDVSPSSKYIRTLMVMNVTAAAVPQQLILCDYLMFYPFIDMGTTESQSMSNVQAIPRYTTGQGVRIMAVLVAPHSLAGDTFFVTYTNQDGVAGRVTPLHGMSTAISVNGTILTTQQTGTSRVGPFMALQNGDSGVRSIESVQCTNGTDVGLFTLVLVRPLCEVSLREITAPVEKDFLLSGFKLPQVIDDAYLNFIACPNGSLSGAALNGDITFMWD